MITCFHSTTIQPTALPPRHITHKMGAVSEIAAAAAKTQLSWAEKKWHGMS